MSAEPVAVLGGTGKTGRAVVEALRGSGADPRPLGRAAWDDLRGAVAGCAAAYLIAPNMHEDEPAYVRDVLAALREAGVPRVVYHSVAAPYVPRMPHHLGKARGEYEVRRSGLAWTILQPGAYLQNLPLDGSPLRLPYRADAPFGLLHLPDLARVAARVLLDDGHEGATYEIASFAATPAQVAAAVGAEVVPMTVREWEQRDGVGLEPRVREWLLAMFRWYDDHGLPAGTLATRTLLGAPTSLEQAVAVGGEVR